MKRKNFLESTKINDLSGQLLISLPNISDPRFEKSVIYICSHTSEGAIGITLNQRIGTLSYDNFFNKIVRDIKPKKSLFKRKYNHKNKDDISLYFGGPVESTRGFILHSGEYKVNDTLMIGKKIGLTTDIDIIRDIAYGDGPKKSLFALGYAGWSSGQLEREFEENSWLNIPADDDLIFNKNNQKKWEQAIRKIGADPSMISNKIGNA